jgi:hypothetical protein
MSLSEDRPYSPISVRTTYHGIPAPKRTITPPGASRRAEKLTGFLGPKERGLRMTIGAIPKLVLLTAES